jgi:cytochrome P450
MDKPWTIDFASDFQLDVPELSEHWDEIIADLHESKCPVAHSTVGEGFHVLLRDADVRTAGRDWETFSSRDGFMPNRPADMPFWYPVECDPPFHDQLRSHLNPYLSPKAIGSREDEIRAHANALIDEFIDKGEVDIVASFSTPLPGRVFCDMVANIPLEDLPDLTHKLHLGLLGPLEGRGAAMSSVQQYMDSYLKRRSQEPPKNDIVDAILAVDLEGFDWDDRTGTLSQLTLGGVGTSGHVIAAILHFLADKPDLRAQLGQPGGITPRAIEEFVRIFASSPHDGRRVTRDVTLGEVDFKEGDFVVLGYGEACRDPEVFENPEEVDLERFPNPHIGFGTGVHRCIGSHLARSQVRIAVETFLTRIPDYTMPDGFTPSYETGITRSMVSLPVSFDV